MAEITTTQSFSDGDTVTATKLNNIQGNASIQPEAITNRSAETSIDQANDLLLVYDASATALKKVSPSNLIKAGTASDFPITGNATIGGTLGVTGSSTLAGTLGVTGAITATSTINGTTIPTTKTLVTTVDTQTLTNKTLTSPSISTPTITGQITASTSIIDVGSGQIYKDASGNIGVGNASPSAKLHVASTSCDVIIQDSDTARASSPAALLSFWGSDARAGYIGYPSDSNMYINQTNSGAILFLTNNTERLRIDSSGNVGVGTASPVSVLDISKASDTSERAIKVQNSSSDLYIGTEGTSGNRFSGSSANNVFFGTTSAAGIEFATNNTVRAKIDLSGNVGIGTASPATKLDVVGEINLPNGNALKWGNSNNYIAGNGASNVVLLATNSVERLRIASNGQIGIGTTSPTATLHLSSPDCALTLQDNNTAGNGSNNLTSYVNFTDSGASQTGYIGFAGEPNLVVWNATASSIRFGANNVERLRIASDGQIGIGGANYGTSGQVLTSAGASAAPSWTTIQSGKILQVVSVTKTDVFSTTSTSFTDITGLSASITPSSTSNKILVICNVSGSVSGDSNRGLLRLLRVGGTTDAIAIGDAASNRTRSSCAISSYSWMALSASVTHLDSPLSTSSKTYKMQVLTNTGTVYINRTGSDADSVDAPRTVSSITLMEVLP